MTDTQLLIDCRALIEQYSSEMGYGFYRPKNPHEFTPDYESCSKDEIAAHKAACEAFDVGKYEHDGWDGWNDDHTIHVLKAPWGIGSYVIHNEYVEDMIKRIDAALAVQHTAAEARVTVTDEMVYRFLGWKLPDDFSPDAGISFDPVFNKGTPYEMRHQPVGTNLLNFEQARAMLEHVLAVADQLSGEHNV